MPNILRDKALYSKAMLSSKGALSSVNSGGNALSHSLDLRNDNWNKVSLSLTPYLPMAYHRKRDQHLCYFVLRSEIAALSGVVFTDTNAAKNDHKRDEGLQGLNLINFEVVRSLTRVDKDTWKKYIQAEVLIPTSISFEYIDKISFVSRASKEHTERLCKTLPHPKFMVEETLFTDSQRASKGSISFAYVVELILTDTNIDKNVLYLSQLNKNKFSKNSNPVVTLAAFVSALAGTRTTVFLSTSSSKAQERQMLDMAEFDASNLYLYRHRITLENLSTGIYLIEYYLDDLCRASLEFEILE